MCNRLMKLFVGGICILSAVRINYYKFFLVNLLRVLIVYFFNAEIYGSQDNMLMHNYVDDADFFFFLLNVSNTT